MVSKRVAPGSCGRNASSAAAKSKDRSSISKYSTNGNSGNIKGKTSAISITPKPILWASLLTVSCLIYWLFVTNETTTSAFSDLTDIGQPSPLYWLKKKLEHSVIPYVKRTRPYDSATVYLGKHGAVRSAVSREQHHLLKLLVQPIYLGEERYVTGNDFSVIISVRNEEKYIGRTLRYLFGDTEADVLREVVIIDDSSDILVENLLKDEMPAQIFEKLKFIRFDRPQGLIRGRVAGAAMATSDNIFFLDGHCKPLKGWAQPLLAHLKTNYRRVACPLIFDIREDTWEDVGTHGSKMMFEWTFEFGWFSDEEVEVPVMSGGILAMTKKWWNESGKYDKKMLEWGGENLEQSIRLWMCGGDVVAESASKIGHIFSRPPKPNPGNSLVIQVQKNQKRGAKVWLDEYYALFWKYHPEIRNHVEGNIEDRRVLRFEELKCTPFQWFVDKFKSAFQRKGLLDHEFVNIKNNKTGLCIAGVPQPGGGPKDYKTVILEPCADASRQKWQVIGGGRMLYHRASGHCLDGALQTGNASPILYFCDWESALNGANKNQAWQWDVPTAYPAPRDALITPSNRIFLSRTKDMGTLTGTDIVPLRRRDASNKKNVCLAAEEQQGKQGLVMKQCLEVRGGEGGRTDDDANFQFVPAFERPPMSSRFVKNKVENAAKINEQYAVNYLRQYPEM